MKKVITILSVILLFFGSAVSASATTENRNFPDAPPGYDFRFGIGVEPINNCRAGTANTEGYGDHLYASLWDNNSPETGEWGVAAETFDAVEDVFYYTPTYTVDCQIHDGASGEVRNTTYPCEQWVLRYQYDF